MKEAMEYLSIPTAWAGVITDAKPMTALLGNVLNFLLSVAGVVGIIGLVISGVWYMTAGGDEDRVRLAKRMAVASVIGIIVVVGALVMVTQIVNFFS